MKNSLPALVNIMETIRGICLTVMDYPSQTAMYRAVATVVAGIFGWNFVGWPITQATLGGLTLLALLINTGLSNYLFVCFMTVPRDVRALIILIKFRLCAYRFYKNNWSIPRVFKECVKQFPTKTMFLFEDQTWTYRQADEYSNRIANTFWEAGYRPGDVVALFMESRPEFVLTWLGLAKIGVVSALINFNLRKQPLVHSITTANSKAVIFGSELTQALEDVVSQLPSDTKFYVAGEDKCATFAQPLNDLLETSSIAEPPPPNTNCADPMIFIYTSGTTGLPKAAVISHMRFYFISVGTYYTMGMNRSDIIYDAMPLYHTMGGAMGVGQAVCNGLPVTIRKKFSATQFWDDCIKYNCTVAQYIGEICRYLLAQPKKPQDLTHKIRLMFGNGLRPQIWSTFVKRFGVSNIREIYGATEGNANIVNMESKPGAVGFISRIAPFAYPCSLIRVNEKTGQPVRNGRGLCIPCRPGEPGEFVGKIQVNSPDRSFDGYVNKSASEKKIIKDVFHRGDTAFVSGDILVMDNYGFLYFKDRTGDTFRWKGENVSTAEVEAAISNIIGLKDCVVYGVEVPGNEGRAGMASILDADHTLDLNDLALAIQKSLPAYARPLFIRILDTLPLTGTYKMKKVDLQVEGFNPSKCGSTKLYYLKGTKYEALNDQAYVDICSGKVRL